MVVASKMWGKINIADVASRPRGVFTGTLVARVEYTMGDGKGEAFHNVGEHEALSLMPKKVTSLMDIERYLYRIESLYLEGRMDTTWLEDEHLVDAYTKTEREGHAPEVANLIKAGIADFIPTRFVPRARDENEAHERLLRQLGAWTYVLERAGHTVMLYKQPRIILSPGKIRVTGTYPGMKEENELFYTTGAHYELPRPKNQQEAMRLVEL